MPISSTIRIVSTAALVLLLLGGCKVGPDYKRPAVEVPPDWRWKTAEPSDAVPRGAWWAIFEDPALNTLVQQAIEGNLTLQAAFFRVEQARTQARISQADFYPQIDVAGTFTRYRTSGNSPSPVPFPVPSFTQQQWSIPFDLTYELDLWGRVRRSFESAQQLALASEAARETALLSLQADVAGAYFSLNTADREINLLKQTIELRQEGLQIFQQRLQAGIGNEFEVQRTRVEIASAQAELQAALRRRVQLVNNLALLSGKPVNGFEIPLNTNVLSIPVVAPDLPSSLLERRPDVAQAERELASRMAQVGVAKAAFFPSVRLTASGGVLSGELTDLFQWESRTWSLAPRIDLPIFAGGRNRAALEGARAAYEEGVALYRQQVLVAFREVEDSLSALQFLKAEAEARRQAAEAATLSTRISFDRYRAGAVNFLDVIDSENARLQNELAHLRIMNEQTSRHRPVDQSPGWRVEMIIL